jgi:hypothetical protein
VTAVDQESADVLSLTMHPDLEAARSRLRERGVEVDEIRHKTPIDACDGGFAHGLDPGRRDYASFAGFSDPAGNGWVLQERDYRSA